MVTAREGLGALGGAESVETRRSREGGSFVRAAETTHTSLLHARLQRLANVEISDLAVYFATIAARCV
ncbi:hypothetical protein [Paenarthrobacter sp. PH39-S1]|uniref:hypothetical protein n=1 Tax=Paenarthrobacter sp. PH39-S1 TaxID=3046204 RepID=UPI0024BB8BE1|nr:hypothetical protein [Paenarthrobacter sp. PH39-S1]MDJ0357086.1 hypothetical protein [Paenarthrobacter sp. PH39-S1]